MPDPGLETVKFVFETLNAQEWSVREQRGFSWWGKSLAFPQRVWAEAPSEDKGRRVCRVHARTDVLRGVRRSNDNLAFLNAMNASASMSGLTLDLNEGRNAHLASSVYVDEENVEVMKRFFFIAVALQAAESRNKGLGLAHLVRAQGGSESGSDGDANRQENADDMPAIVARSVQREGQNPSWWKPEEFQAAMSALRQRPEAMVSGGEQNLAAEFPFSGLSSFLRVSADEVHPQFGHGIKFRLTLGTNIAQEEAHRLALTLNQKELMCQTRFPFLGSWCTEDSALSLRYVAFYPNITYRPGLLQTLAEHMAARAEWITSHFFERTKAASTDSRDAAQA